MPFQSAKDPSGATIVTVEGQLIVANRQDLKSLIQDALEAGERKFVVDFSPTAYIDSSGLGALVSINKKVREAGGELRLAGLNEDLRALFELTKLDTLFAISDTTAEALVGL
jgi:anti-sigma B factor antagonist